jgi:hypothetical protein
LRLADGAARSLRPVKEIAQIGAAIGREFSWELIAAVAPHARPELDQALTQLVESGLAFQRGTPPDAVCTFKHALVQGTAYDSLLRRRRQELHGKIAEAIEERWPHTEATEPELLAQHYTEAKLLPKAIPLWHKAGSLVLGRMALAEAIAQLNKGLELVAALPPSTERDGSELDLGTLFGTASMALKGWPAQEIWDSLHPALGLANSLRRNDALVPYSGDCSSMSAREDGWPNRCCAGFFEAVGPTKESPQLTVNARVVLHQPAELAMHPGVALVGVPADFEDEGLSRMKPGEIRRPPGGFMQIDAQHRLGVVEQLPRFIEKGAGLDLHRSMPSARMAYISGMRSSS